MGAKQSRVLTSLEYVVLGLIGLKPQSGYDIINYFAPAGAYRWSASPGAIYPVLKRLEKQGIIDAELEMVRELRPRKLYRLSQLGTELLEAWLREVPPLLPLYEQREMAMWRFQFMEGRLTTSEIVRWIDDYLDGLRGYDYGRRIYTDAIMAAMTEHGQESVHQQLLLESTLMEINTLRTWLEMARTRITAAARSTGEVKSVEE
jgi:DNA-binding PadR family transcriptional regulator